MKVVERNFDREVDASAAAVWWNYWDHEHLVVVHKNYTDAKILYEDQRMATLLLTYKLPIFSWIKSQSLNIMIKKDEETIRAINTGLLGIPVVTTIKVIENRHDHCLIKINYRFFLMGWKQILAPLLNIMIPQWNERVWQEDLPLKLRRSKMLQLGFKDFYGLPVKVEDRSHEGEIKFIRIPLSKLREVNVNSWRKFSEVDW